MDVITRTVEIVMRDRVERDLALLKHRARITLIQPELQEGPNMGKFSDVSQLLKRGERLGKGIVDQCFDRRGRLRPASSLAR